MPEESTTPDLVERTRRSFAAANRSDWDAVMGFFAHDAVWAVPEFQTFEGRDAIRGFLEDWVGAYQDAEIEVEDVLDLGGGITFLTATLNGRLVGSTAHMRVRFGAAYRWVGALIAHIASYSDIDEARAAAEGLAEERVRAMSQQNEEIAERALEQVRALAGPAATIDSVVLLEGGQHAATWRVDTASPVLTVVVRQFPFGDSAGESETRVLQALDGLGGLAPVLLGSDLAGRWSECPTTLISWLDGDADILPSNPDAWAIQLGHTLASLHALPRDRLSALPSLFDQSGGSREALAGPVATRVRSDWPQITSSPEVLTHGDFWSGNVVWRDGVLSGIVDWSGATRGPRGFDVGWCRLDLYLLFDERIADVFLAAYEDATNHPVRDMAVWDGWAVARAHEIVETWVPNYLPLGRADLDEDELRRRHSQWTDRLLKQR